MDTQAELDAFLRREGLPPKLLRLQRRRARSTVWSAALAGPMGDANLEILVYALGEHPEHFTDFEDDKAALSAMGSLGRADEGEVVFAGRGGPLGVIVLAAGLEARIARAARDVLLNHPEDELSLCYHPQLDRILNGSWFGKLGTGWTRSSLMALDHATALHAATDRLLAATSGVLPGDAVPRTLAILENERVAVTVGGHDREVTPDELLTLPTMVLAPPRYRRLAQYVSVIADPHTVDDPAAAATARADLSGFASRLLGVVAAGHHGASATFRAGAGSCLRPEFVDPSGRLTDLYFLRSADGTDGRELSALQVDDIANALDTVRTIAGRPGEPLADALTAAAAAYTGAAPAPALARFARDVGSDPVEDPGNRALSALALELRRAR